jgi:hypothetical protein
MAWVGTVSRTEKFLARRISVSLVNWVNIVDTWILATAASIQVLAQTHKALHTMLRYQWVMIVMPHMFALSGGEV